MACCWRPTISARSAPNDEYARQFATNLLERLHRVPSVESVALANAMPLDIHGLPLRGFRLEGRAQTTHATGNGAEQHRLAGLFQDHWYSDRGR